MKIRELSRNLLTLALLLWSVASIAAGNYSGPNRDANGNIVPTPKGEKCVEPTADMRANHMKYLLHKRDKTMYQGIRTEQHSLVECINCHATPGENGKIARITDKQHVCASCHISASVKLDCFECHADRPVEAFNQAQTDDLFSLEMHSKLQSSNKPHAAMNRKVQ